MGANERKKHFVKKRLFISLFVIIILLFGYGKGEMNVTVNDKMHWFTDEQIENLISNMEELMQVEMPNVTVHIGQEMEYYKEIPIVYIMFECDQGVFEGYAEIDTGCIVTYIG